MRLARSRTVSQPSTLMSFNNKLSRSRDGMPVADTPFGAEFLEKERRALGEHEFKREYLGIPLGGQASPFTWELYERATQVHVPLVPPGPAFGPPAQERAVPIPNPFQRVNPLGVVP